MSLQVPTFQVLYFNLLYWRRCNGDWLRYYYDGSFLLDESLLYCGFSNPSLPTSESSAVNFHLHVFYMRYRTGVHITYDAVARYGVDNSSRAALSKYDG